MAVNPKKLRPYDQPPKVRRPLLPNEPDNAATAFLVAAVVWFLVATGIGLLWTALQLFPDQLSLKLHAPTISGVLTFDLSPATTASGFWDSLVYGWLGNAGLGAVFFIPPRLLGRRLVATTCEQIGRRNVPRLVFRGRAVEIGEHERIGKEDSVVEERLRRHEAQSDQRAAPISLEQRSRDFAERRVTAHAQSYRRAATTAATAPAG